ncbi:MAG: penicillin-binding protein activator LpoB [Thermodesulfobacteriota bacterium]
MKKVISLICLLAALTFINGCAKTTKIEYGDAKAVETTTMGFGSTDLQVIAADLVDELLAFGPIVAETKDRRPVVFVDKIRNKSTEHIDTESITDSIQTKLIKSGKFRFVDMTAVAAVSDQFDFQYESGMVNPMQAIAFGKQVGAEYMLYGNLSSIIKRSERSQDSYYKFSLKMLNMESGILEWMGEKEIRKTAKKGFVGR